MFRSNLNMSSRMQQQTQTYHLQSSPSPSNVSMKPMFQFKNTTADLNGKQQQQLQQHQQHHIEILHISVPATIVRPTHVTMRTIPLNSVSPPPVSIPNQFSAHVPSSTLSTVEPPTNTRARWGNPTWTFFHTIAEKIHPNHFDEIRESMLNMIYTICVNLPCPECAMHAKQFLDTVNFQSIQTANDFRTTLWNFHNTVNARRGVPLFSFDMLQTTYSNTNTVNVVMNFLKVFQDRHYNTRNVANDFHRKRAIVAFKEWIRDNLYKFYQ